MDKLKKEKPDIMKRISAYIVDYRFVIFLVFLAAVIYCALSVGKVKVNGEMTYFLPEEAETRRGIKIMDEEFVTYATTSLMVSNVTYDEACRLADEIREIDGVFSVDLDDTTAHYVGSSALLSITFDGLSDDASAAAAEAEIESLVAEYDTYIQSTVGYDLFADIMAEMSGVMVIAVIVVIVVLLSTSKSYFEAVIFLIVFVVAALLNMGTNFWIGEISSITNSIAVILQLALAIDYSIILVHRYQDEVKNFPTEREALIEALSKAIIEISSSSLTTVSGLIALTFMQFRLGYDLGVVLTKGILCSLITVFLLMPGVIMLFPKMLKKTAHKSHIPDMHPWGNFLMKSHHIFAIILIIIIPISIICSSKVSYMFSEETIDELIYSESREAMHKISDTFDNFTSVVVLVPHEDLDSEKSLLSELGELDGTKSAMGLANSYIDDTHVLTDRFTPYMFSDLVGIDPELSTLLFEAYGLEHGEYQAIFGDTDEYSVPLIDMFLYLFDKIDSGVVTLDGDMADMMGEMRGTLERALNQLRGTNYNRLVLTSTLLTEGEESTAYVEEVRSIAESYYGTGNVLVIGDITSANDLAASYNSDSTKINLMTIVFVFLILLFTFKSVVGAAVLVFVIQGSIWINFSIFYLEQMRTCFVTYMIVSAIQMGATIDYAIVMMSRYQAHKALGLPKKEAMVNAVSESFATIFTSGTIMTVAGFLIAFKVTDVYAGHIGLAVGRGALISVILVLTVLPQLLVLIDKLIDKTKFTININIGGKDK